MPNPIRYVGCSNTGIAGTRKKDIIVDIKPTRLTIRLGWYGRVVNGPLHKRVKATDCYWALDSQCSSIHAAATPNTNNGSSKLASTSNHSSDAVNDGKGNVAAADSASAAAQLPFAELQLLLPKDDGGHYWKALFEGGEEKSHWQVTVVVGGDNIQETQ